MRALFVASTGGHLTELHRLLPRMAIVPQDVTWVTFDTNQSRSLLQGQDVEFVHYVAPRDVVNATRNLAEARRIIDRQPWDVVVSTGSGIALSFLPLARARGIRCHYIESAARDRSPSTTGRMLSAIPGMRLYTQYPAWASRRWQYRGSVFDEFDTTPTEAPRPIRRVLVTLGTIPYSFRRLVDHLLHIVPDHCEIVWQTGATPVDDLPLDARPSLPSAELQAVERRADVIVAHAGIGSALGSLQAGRCPVLVPREQAHDEHVDDHQAYIASELDRRGIAVGRRVEDLTLDDIQRAADTRVGTRAQAPHFALER